jgi:thiol-disulfide isomerase/thioredoxin
VKFSRYILSVIFCPLLQVAMASAQSAPLPHSPAADQVVQAFLRQDGTMYSQVKELARKDHDDLEVQDWNIAIYRPIFMDGTAAAMEKKAPESVWTGFVKAMVAHDQEVPALVEQAWQKAKGDPNALVLATKILLSASRKEEKPDLMKTFISTNKSAYEKTASGLMVEIIALKEMANISHGEASNQELMDLCGKALALDPQNVPAILAKARLLAAEQKVKENYDLIKGTLQAHPGDYSLHEAYWRAVIANPEIKPAEKEREISADVLTLFGKSQPSEDMVNGVVHALQDPYPKLLETVEDLVIKKYPDSAGCDFILYERAGSDLPLATKEQNETAQITAIEAFIDRPKHYSEEMLTYANSALGYLLLGQKHLDVERLYKVATTLYLADPSFYMSPSPAMVIRLADNKAHLPELERMVSKQLENKSFLTAFDIEEFPAKDLRAFSRRMVVGYAVWQQALGWIYFQEGRVGEAQAKLEYSLRLSPDDPEAAIHLGQVFEARGDVDKAEQLFQDAMSDPYYGQGDHPSIAPLRELYVKKRGNDQGLDAYMKPFLEKNQEMRKNNVLSTRVRAPEPLPDFKLATVDGKTISSDTLKGKLVVINFWATWCGPCREEMPDLQKFYDKYKNDPQIVFLSMTLDEPETSNQTVQDFMDKHKYTFPVLRAFEYGRQKCGVYAIPETWFIDRDGKRVFQGIGGGDQLLEEFTWRIDAMRESNPKAADAARAKLD